MMRKYAGNVLIIHGDEDQIAPISYSYEAIETFPHAKLEVIKGAGHGFEEDDEYRAIEMAAEFIKENLD